ncbi:ectoine/hydroxyectoine ABC transporter permease subunit EhuC [Actinopolymorpha sp. B11F2]|uniref:ectoine/hydroxyectoine ABC transporter permease subunit EhuC n=1 Tax=Actinopolymorpha sp. B11F2 TaxID=3160862 RepID=UPI0032E41935
MLSTMLDYLPTLLRGALVALEITAGAAAIGLVMAVLAGLMARARQRAVRAIARIYVEFFRGTSALVQLFWLFFALPLLGWEMHPMFAGIVALGLNIGAYGAEVVRGAVNAVSPGQYEAAIALSFSPAQRMRRIIFPQAVVGMIPPFGNLLIELLKGTALVSLITINDLTFNAQVLRQLTGHTVLIFSMVLVLYFVMAYLMTLGMRWLERRAKASIGQVPVATTQPAVKTVVRKEVPA